MSRAAITSIIIAVIVLGGGTALLVVNHNSSNNQTTSTTNTSTDQSMNGMAMNNSSSQPSSPTPAATSSVVIQNFAFSPASITIKKGTTATWTNKDSTSHTVTETDGQSGPNSGDLATGKSYSFTYSAVGSFKYHCTIHPDMTGTVTVTE